MTRNGKIARLPRAVRDRLADGEPGKALVTWLNGLPEVVAVLDRDFGDHGSTEQIGGMYIMATGVHHSCHLRFVGCLILLLDRQRIHIGAKGYAFFIRVSA